MHCTRLTFLAIATLALANGTAFAADYSQPVYQPPPQPIVIQQPPPATDCCDGWYLRGNIGVGMNNASYDITISPPPPGPIAAQSASDTYFVGLGVGYEWNSWLRFEATAEYRARTRLAALGTFGGGGGPVFVDQLEGYMRSWVFLANAFVDLGTWNCFTPFVGAGIGVAFNQMDSWQDMSPTVPGATGSSFGVGRDTSKTSMAWALYAGVAYNVTKSFKIDFTYRYLDLGSARETIDCNGGSGCFTLDFKNLQSHDFMLGFRWECCELPAPPPPVVYTPPPPLQTRG